MRRLLVDFNWGGWLEDGRGIATLVQGVTGATAICQPISPKVKRSCSSPRTNSRRVPGLDRDPSGGRQGRRVVGHLEVGRASMDAADMALASRFGLDAAVEDHEAAVCSPSVAISDER